MEENKESRVKPVNGLSDATHGILYGDLQGLPLSETNEELFQKLESTLQSGDGEPRASHAPASQKREHSETNDVIRRFNRDTAWLATLVVGALVSAALMLAVLVQNRHPEAVELTEEGVEAGGDLLLKANSSMLFRDVGSKGKNSTGETTSRQASSVDHTFTENSPPESPSSQMEAAGSTPNPVLLYTPEIIHINAHANASSGWPVHWQVSAPVIRTKIHNVRGRSSVRPRFVDVKKRLIALWHQSLKRSEKSRSWTAYSNLSGVRKQAAYTAATNH